MDKYEAQETTDSEIINLFSQLIENNLCYSFSADSIRELFPTYYYIYYLVGMQLIEEGYLSNEGKIINTKK